LHTKSLSSLGRVEVYLLRFLVAKPAIADESSMKSSPTRPSLLLRIRDPQDTLAWSEFVSLYLPLLHAYGMKQGLQDADAADVAQDTFRNLARVASEFNYDPSRGSFRGWLLTVARNEVRKFFLRKNRQASGSGDSGVRSFLEAVPSEQDDEKVWEQQYQLHMFHWAAERVKHEFRDNTWQAFWRTIVDNEPIENVASDLAMSNGAIYVARSRVTTRIRQMIETVEGDPL
jgi:RNA polymerase sigma factor (sigma-70 family)